MMAVGLTREQLAHVCSVVDGEMIDNRDECHVQTVLTPKEFVPFISDGNRYFKMLFHRKDGKIATGVYRVLRMVD